jgi:TadE-like protein
MNHSAHPVRRPPATRLTGLRRLLKADRGSSAIELAILAPALLILTMIVIQFALWFQARQAALAAAQEGAREARILSVSANPGGNPGGNPWTTQVQDDTLKYYDGLGTHILTNVTVTPVYDPADGIAGVTVSGDLNSLLNAFGGMRVTVTVQGPRECFHPVQQGGRC